MSAANESEKPEISRQLSIESSYPEATTGIAETIYKPSQYTVDWGQIEVAPPPILPVDIESKPDENDPDSTVPTARAKKARFWLLLVLAVVVVIAVVGGILLGIASRNRAPTEPTPEISIPTSPSGTASATTNNPSRTTATTATTAMATGGIKGKDYIAKTGLTTSQYQEESEKWTGLDYQLTLLSGYSFNNADRYVAIWEQKNTSSTLYIKEGLTEGVYHSENAYILAQGYYPVLVDAWTVNGEDHYAAIWRGSEGKTVPDYISDHSLSKPEFGDISDKLVGQGYCVEGVSGYSTGDQAQYIGLWSKCPSGSAPNATALRYGLTPEECHDEIETMSDLGYRVAHLNGYSVGFNQDSVAFYDIIFKLALGSSSNWISYYEMTSAELQETLDRLDNSGYRLTEISAYNIGNDDYYTGIWYR